MALSQLLYVSEAVKPFSGEELLELVSHSGKNNRMRQVTGILIYSGGHFVQCLEGETDVIASLFEKITLDARHKNVQQLILKPAGWRLFLNWDMSLLNFESAGALDRSKLEGRLEALKGHAEARRLDEAFHVLEEFRRQLPASIAAA